MATLLSAPLSGRRFGWAIRTSVISECANGRNPSAFTMPLVAKVQHENPRRFAQMQDEMLRKQSALSVLLAS